MSEYHVSALYYPTFRAVRVQGPKCEFIGHAAGPGRLTAVSKIEMYVLRAGVMSFVGYAEGERFEKLAPCMVNAARRYRESKDRVHSDGPGGI